MNPDVAIDTCGTRSSANRSGPAINPPPIPRNPLPTPIPDESAGKKNVFLKFHSMSPDFEIKKLIKLTKKKNDKIKKKKRKYKKKIKNIFKKKKEK